MGRAYMCNIVGTRRNTGCLVGSYLFWHVSTTEPFGDMGELAAAIMGLWSIFLLVVGTIKSMVAYGIWKLNKWARFLGIILVIGEILFILWLVIIEWEFLIFFAVPLIICLVILYFLLIDEKTKNAF